MGVGGRCSRRCPHSRTVRGCCGLGSRDCPPPRGQPQPHRRVLCGVPGGTIGPGWVVLPSVWTPAGRPLWTPAAAALGPHRGVGSKGAGPASARKAAPPAGLGPARRCGGAAAPRPLRARYRLRASPGRASPCRSSQPDPAPQCRSRVPAAAQPSISVRPGPLRPRPFHPSGNEAFCRCGRRAQSAGLQTSTAATPATPIIPPLPSSPLTPTVAQLFITAETLITAANPRAASP